MKSEELINHASLSIIEYAHHVRTTLNVRNRTLPWHIMTYLKSGHAVVRINGQEYECGPGTVALIPAGVEHDHIANNENSPAIFLWWHFTYTISGSIDIFKFFNWPITFEVKQNLQFEHLFSQYIELLNDKPSIPNSIMAQARSLEIMSLLFENMFENKTDRLPDSDIPSSFLEILNEIIEHPENGIHLKEFSRHYHMHPTYISNRFKHHFGITPTQFHHEVVVQRACRLLRATDMSVTDIAYKMGFSDLSAFTQIFTKMQGYSPTQYRNGNFLKNTSLN